MKIPQELIDRDQWVCWRLPNKKPIDVRTGHGADSTDPRTWSSFTDATLAMRNFGHDGIGYVFAADDPLCGVDLDGCRHPESGQVENWAKRIILALGSYAEVSPSGSGVKIFCRCESPWDRGRQFDNLTVEAPEGVPKRAGIEVYDRGRFFAVTGQRLAGHGEIKSVESDAIRSLVEELLIKPADRPIRQGESKLQHDATVIDRARKYVAAIPASVSGQGGDKQTFCVACALVLGFNFSIDQALPLLLEYSDRCEPPWTARELEHKLRSADRLPEERGYLIGDTSQPLRSYAIPPAEEKPKAEPTELATLQQHAVDYVATLRAGDVRTLVETNLGGLDYALSGGLDLGEMAIIAGRPGHGKSAIGMQMVYSFARQGVPTLVISEEMSAVSLAKRAVQFATPVDESIWNYNVDKVESQVSDMFEPMEPIYVATDVGTAGRAYQLAEQAKANGAKAVLIDYAQLLSSEGKGRYEQITNTSITLSKIARTLGMLTIVLCQCNRQLEGRTNIMPNMADLRDSGQLEQDADVILFGVWVCRIAQDAAKEEYRISVAKSRNREIKEAIVSCKFEPRRMRVVELPAEQARRRDEVTAGDDFQ